MVDSIQTELEKLCAAAEGLEAQRALLGDAIVQPALDSLHEKIAALERQQLAERGASEERRIVTILFADLVGSTSLASQFDPEEWREIITAVHSQAGALIFDFSGKILQYLGDGLLAVFGSHNASEKDPDNALRAALAIQNDLPCLNEDRFQNRGINLQMRIGIHTGLVVIGELVTETKRELTATGDAMNVAARLQSSAPPGGILITHDTFRYVRQSFELEPQPPLMVKGKTEPLRTYLVQQARPARFRTVTRGVAGIDTPTFGRQAELDQLRSAYDEVVEQQSVKWLQLIGEAGVGKSRLLAEMRAYFPQCTPAYHLFKGRAYPGDESQAYAIPRRMWLDYFHIPEDSPPEDIEAQWKAAIQALLPFNQDEAWLAEAAHALGFLLGLPFAQPNLYTVQPDQLKNLSFLISRQLLLPLRQSYPLVLLLEDVQWLDQASWEYLYDLFLEAATSQGLLILATSRQDWSPPPELQAHAAYCELTVRSLTPSACGQLTHSLLKDIRGVPEKVIQRIIQRAEGIPYFVEEMVNWLLDLGVIDQSVQPWQFVAEKYDPALLPDTLQHLLQTRLDNLDTQSKTILQYGSVLGRRFWESWLEAQFACPCQEALQALQARGFIMQSSKVTFEDETEWRFSHQVQQEVAYASMLKRKRKDLHQAAVEWLEWRAGKSHRLDEFAGPIGDHAREAGYLQKASAWYLRAGNHAKQRGALAEARHYYESALKQLPDHDLEGRWPILLEHDEVLGFLSDTQARLVEDELLVSLAQQSGQEAYLAEAYFRQGSYLFNLGDYQKSVDLLRPAYQHAINTCDNALASRAASMHMISLVRLGQTKEAYYWVEKAQELSSKCRDDLTQAMVLNNLSLYYTSLGDHFQSAQLINQQVMLTRKMKHRMGEARGLGNLGYAYILLGLFPIGIVTLEQALELTNVYGMQQDAAYAQLNLGLAYLRVKDFTSARQELETAMRHLDVMQDQFGLAAGKLYLGLAYEQHGDFQAAQDWFYQAAQVFTRLSIPGSAMDCQAGLARCALKQGDLPSAEALVRELWVYLREHQAIALEFPFLAYQTCIMIFEQCRQFQQMSEALRTGYELLVEKANRISEFTWREVYLQEIPENQWIFNQMSIHQKSQS